MWMEFPSRESGPKGSLHLATNALASRVHSVETLNPPLLEGRFCIISTIGPTPEESYCLELKDQATTKLFADCLQGLQNTVKHHRPEAWATRHNGGADSGPPNASGGMSSSTQECKSQSAQNSTNSTRVAEKGTQTEYLIDIGEDLSTPSSKVDIRKAAEEILNHLNQVAEALAAARILKSFKPVAAVVVKILTEKYPTLGCMGCVKVSEAVEGIVNILVGLKRSTTQQTEVQIPESVKDFLKPITYSPESLKKFRHRGVLPKCPVSPTLANGTRPRSSYGLDYVLKENGKSRRSQGEGHY